MVSMVWFAPPSKPVTLIFFKCGVRSSLNYYTLGGTITNNSACNRSVFNAFYIDSYRRNFSNLVLVFKPVTNPVVK